MAQFILTLALLLTIGLCSRSTLAEAPSETEILPPADQRFAGLNAAEVPDFQRHVVPLLGRLGCNGRSCHGSFQGQGGLRLSLFGYDFGMDYTALTADASSEKGPRINRQHPEESLVILKPTMAVDHEGGLRFDPDSWQQELLRRWIAAGAIGVQEKRELAQLSIEPPEVRFGPATQSASTNVQLRVVAEWEDGHREDVTPLCRFRTNDDSIVAVDQSGLLTSKGSGDTHVIAFYDNGIAAVPVLRPFASSPDIIARPIAVTDPGEEPVFQDAPQGIDSLVAAKLQKLGIVASQNCTDSEFLRRACIDLTGTLPAPEEVESFLADQTPDKRRRLVDSLLQRPAYAAWWTNKLCDFTGCNPNQQAELGQETSVQWYSWIFERVSENVPYDELIRRIVLAKSRQDGQTYDEYAQQTSAYFRDEQPAEFSDRETMPHYWTRRSMQQPSDAAQAFAHNFLGIRLQCAQCHKHPFAAWTQDDFKDFSQFFENVKFGIPSQSQERYGELAKQFGISLRGDNGVAIRSDVLRHARRGQTVPWRELYVATRAQPVTLSLLRSETIELEADEDPRESIMRWMLSSDNPWFARAFVNRVWASYFHVGIVDPPDDLNPANPPSNGPLLDWLTAGFVQHNYDMKWLHREIVTSHTYQRSWRPSVNNADDRRNFSRAIPRRMPAEVVYDSIKQALAASDQLDEVRSDLTRRAIGHLSMRLAGTYAMRVFGKPERVVNCDCERDNQPTLLQAVFLQNDPLVDQRLEDSGWLQEIEAHASTLEPEELVRQAWLRTVNRFPTQDEFARGMQHLNTTDSLAEGMRDLLWALLNTKEFLLIQ